MEDVIALEEPAPKPRKKVFRNVFIGLLYFFSISIGSLFGFFLSYLNRLPQVDQIANYRPNIPTQVLAQNGQPVGEFFVEKRVILHNVDDISPNLRKAIIAVEDAHFYEHPGVDPWGILRALYVNLRTGHVVEGGSTLTQQLAKMLFLKPEKTMERKILEAMLAVQLERRYTKDEVLLYYCNQVYLGHGVYGVQAASNYYFGKSAHDLTLDEAAILAALPKAPQEFSPYLHADRALQRRNHVLERMIAERFVSKQEGEAAIKMPLNVRPQLPARSIGSYFTEEVRQYLEKKYGYSGLYESGLQIHSTLNVDMQKVAEVAVDKGVRRLDKRHGWRKPVIKLKESQWMSYQSPDWDGKWEAGRIVQGVVLESSDRVVMVRIADQKVALFPADWAWTNRKTGTSLLEPGDVSDFKIKEVNDGKIASIELDQRPLINGALIAMEVKTGKILALVGGDDFTQTKFDHATQAYRQPGSAFKPFIYAAAFERGFTPSDVMVDQPISYYDPWTKLTWSPGNYTGDFLGPMTLRRALELSRNTVAIQLLEQIGVKYAINYAQRFGVSKNMQPYLPLALGVSETTLIDLVRSYSAFANRGLMMEPIYVDKILDRDGNLLEENLPHAKEVMRADIAYLMTDVLEGVVRRGTAVKARSLNRPLAGKTGTTDDYSDAWFIGYTPSLICGVWIGYDDRKSLGKGQTGAEAALPIWIDFMQTVLKDTPPEDFQATTNIVTVAIDRLTGLRATPDCTDVIIESFIAGTEPHQFCGPEHHTGNVPLSEEEKEVGTDPEKPH